MFHRSGPARLDVPSIRLGTAPDDGIKWRMRLGGQVRRPGPGNSSAVVVGGTGGLGEATVRRLVAAGAKVVVADVADDKGKALEQELDVRYVQADATVEDDVRAAMDEARALGPLRISVDAHGGPASGGRLLGKTGKPLDLAAFRTTIEYYLTGVFNVMRLAAAAIARSEPADGQRGVIVNTASIAAYEGRSASSPTPPPRAGW
jgi:NAD(P)-dependent dehydrogenase (short-subunit alcohol dehydrogenase family)